MVVPKQTRRNCGLLNDLTIGDSLTVENAFIISRVIEFRLTYQLTILIWY